MSGLDEIAGAEASRGNDSNSEDALRQRRKWKKTLLRLSISLALVILLFRTIDRTEFVSIISRMSLVSVFACAALYTFGQFLSAIKWRVFILESDIPCSLGQAIKAYFTGMAVNTLGLGTLGGDVVRGLAIRPGQRKRAASLATVVADRIHGLAVLGSIGAFAFLYVRPEVLGHWAEPLALLFVAGLVLIWYWGPRLLQRLFPEDHKYGLAAQQITQAFPHHTAPLIEATLVSFVFHISQIFLFAFICHQLQINIGLGYLFAVVPIINVASTMPFSINGLGIREWFNIFLLVPAGATHEQAVAVGAIWLVVVSAVSIIGGAIVTAGSPLSLVRQSRTSPSN